MFKHSLMTLAAIGAALVGLSATQASAFNATPQASLHTASNSLLLEVRDGGRYNGNQDRVFNNNRTYNRNMHGDRCSNWSNNCRYQRGNYWYASPWWAVPVAGAGFVIGTTGAYGGRYDGYGYGNRHVGWCMNRYQSYNPRSNTWMSYNGRVRQCVSPYGA